MYFLKNYGAQIKNGKIIFDKLYKYKFITEELKAPIISLITTSGWGYAPRVI